MEGNRILRLVRSKSAISKLEGILAICVIVAAAFAGYFAYVATMPPAVTVLTWSTSLAEEEWGVMRKHILPLFEERYNCSVRALEIAAADLEDKLEAMKTAGKMEIDVFAQDNMLLGPLVEKDLVEDLSGYENRISAHVLPALIDACVFDEKLMFMPYRPNVQLTYYNSTAFEDYDLTVPTDWDELLNVAQTFHPAGTGQGKVGIKGVLWAPTTAQIYEWIVSAGGDPLTLNDTGCVDTFEFLVDLWPYCAQAESKLAKWDTTNTYIAQGVFYIAQNWPFGVPVIIKDFNKTEIKTYHGWSGPVEEAHVVGGEVFGIPKGSPNLDLAVEFIWFMQSKEVQEILASKLAWPSIRDDALGDVEDWLQPHFEEVQEALEYGVFRTNVPWWEDFDKYFNEAFEKIVYDGEPIKATLDYYAAQLEEAKE